MRSIQAALCFTLLTGCVGELSFDPDGEGGTYGRTFDLRQAESLWLELEGHEMWPSFSGKEGVQTSASPHGAFSTLHLNEIAALDADAPAFGSIIVKRNLATADAIEPAAYTVMKRVRNFDPDDNDWFWAKFEVDGTVALDEAGVPLAGAIGKGADSGCIGCHQNAPGGDFLFSNGPATTFGTPRDLELAGTLWATIAPHTTWPSFDGKEGVQPGSSPHGAFVTFHINDVAAADQTNLPTGSIVVKRNQGTEDPASVAAITVMQKIAGYDAANADWFYAKFSPAGVVEMNTEGIPLAGAVGKGGTDGCIPCHAGAPGGDFVFVNAGGTGP